MPPRIAIAIVAVVLTAVLAGCVPESSAPPPSTSSPVAASPFDSEAAAFAAAEETYRAYVEALNQRRVDDDLADPEKFLRGAALEADIGAQRKLSDRGLSIEGRTAVDSVVPIGSSEDFVIVEITACLDSGDTRVVDRNGQDVTPSSRPARTLVDVSLEWSNREYVITESVANETASC